MLPEPMTPMFTPPPFPSDPPGRGSGPPWDPGHPPPPGRRAAARTRPSCPGPQGLVELGLYAGLRQRPDDAADLLAVPEDEQRGDGTHPVAYGYLRVRVHIQLQDVEALRPLACDLIHDGPYHPARRAPRGPQIHQNGPPRREDL